MSLKERYLIFFIGVVVQASGIALITRSTLGSPPISAAPYVLSVLTDFTLGQYTFLINALMIVGQVALLRGRFKHIQILQLPVTVIFASSLDLFMYLFKWTIVDFYPLNMVVLFVGITFLAFGVAMQVIANVLMLPGEGIVYAISTVSKIEFAKVKTCFDIGMVLLAIGLSLFFLHTLVGAREGTVASALCTGYIARFLIHRFSRIDPESASLVFRWPWQRVTQSTDDSSKS